jgi:hypothetical protein
MTHFKSIVITIALSVLVIFAGISVSDASQSIVKHRVKGRHKHTVVKRGITGKYRDASFQTLAKPEAEVERGATAPPDAWSLHIPDNLRAAWNKSDREAQLKMDGILGGTGSPIDTVALLGPFHQGGITTGLLVSSANPNIYFACTPRGGLWKSTNMGALWLPLDTPAIQAAVCITQNPFHPDTIYVSAGAVYKSYDGGSTFSATSGSAGMAIACDQADTNTVYSGYGGSLGLMRSTDAGNTWGSALSTSGSVWSILALPSGAVLVGVYGDGIYRATVGKTGTFTKITSSAFPSSDSIYNINIANSKSFPNVIYASFDGPPGVTGFCKSSDGGVTWIAEDITPLTGTGGIGRNQWGYPTMLGVSNTDTNRVVFGIQTTKYSTNGGSTWNATVFFHADGHSYANFPGTSNKFIHGCDGGIGTQNWGFSSHYGVDSIQVSALDTILSYNYVSTVFNGGDFASSGRRCFGGATDVRGFRFRPSDSGVDVGSGGGGDGADAHISQQDSNTAYFQGQGGWLQKSINFFSTTPSWTTITPTWTGVGEGPSSWNIWPINYADGQQLYVSSNQAVWRTTNGGTSWDRLNSANITGINDIGCTNPTPATNPTIYWGSYDGTNHHFYRIDNAKTAPANGTPVDLSATLPNTADPMGRISPYPTKPSTLYIGFQGSSTTHHAWKVLNANTATPTWVDISGTTTPLPSGLGVNQVQADPLDSTTLLAATVSGLYYSTNTGADWHKETRIPTTTDIREIQLRALDRKIFLFAQGRGVWYCSLKSGGHIGGVQQASVSLAQPANTFQFSLYPTPAASKLNITLKDELSSSARMVIYDMTGHTVSGNLWNAGAGESQEADISKLASGVYFLQIQDGDKSSTQKFEKM